MKKTLITLICLLGLLTLTAGGALATVELLTLAPVVSGQMALSGTGTSGNISFMAGTGGNDFQILTSTGGTANGDVGTITGTYSFTSSSITLEGAGPATQAPLTGTGLLTIKDGSGHSLTANVTSLVKVETNNAGTSLPINDLLVVNLSSIAYTGTQQDLLNLLHYDNGSAVLDLTGTFGTDTTLAQIAGSGYSQDIAYSGDIRVTPLPGSALLLGSGLLGLALLGFRRKGVFEL